MSRHQSFLDTHTPDVNTAASLLTLCWSSGVLENADSLGVMHRGSSACRCGAQSTAERPNRRVRGSEPIRTGIWTRLV